MFIWPTDVRRITSHYQKNRKHPITGKVITHNGTDIAAPGHHTIKAAAAGTVSRSYRSDSYGECIMILHNVDGQTWETVYAHMQSGSRKVYPNSKVKQGQAIGIMGSTGHATGQHLHFEIHQGRWNVNKSNAVDPIKYLKESGSAQEDLTDNSITYLVKAGDSLSMIAASHNTTVNQLIDLNGIKNKNLIYPGQVLQLKKGSSSYTIKNGDTLSQIAINNKTTVSKLVSLNKIKDKNKIQIGQQIKLI